MRLGFISDIHVDINRKNGEDIVLKPLAEETLRQGLDCLVIAGDISSDYKLTLESIDFLGRETGKQIYFVPGNHDLWNENHPDTLAWDTYNALLEHPGNICRGPVHLNGEWAMAGEIGWYDFKFGDPSFTMEEFELMKHEERLWQDKIRTLWDRDTKAMNELFLKRMETQLDKVAGKKIIAVTHVIPVNDFTVNPERKIWRYFNAFLGSPEYGDLFIKRNVSVSVSGHVHYRKRVKKENTEFLCVCLGYSSEWPPSSNPSAEIRDTLQTIDIG